MNENDLPHPGRIEENSAGLGVPSPEQVEERARELAIIDGRTADEVNDGDRDQAKRELGGRVGKDATQTEGDSLPTGRGEPAGTRGTKATTHRPQDEARIDEQLVSEGVKEALHDKMLKAGRKEIDEGA